MSHVIRIQTQVRDAEAVRLACRRLGLAEPVQGTTRLYSGEVTGLAVQLPGWRYPAVCQLDTGQIQFDNFQGNWGEQKELDRFVQGYTVEKAKLEARRKGHTVSEQQLQDGSIKLTIQVTGGVA
jgi:hypothetical protein